MAITETAVEQVRQNVLRALEKDSRYDFAGIGVAVAGDLVTLTGVVETAAQKQIAEEDVLSVPEVRAVVNEIEIRGGVEIVVEEDERTSSAIREALRGAPHLDSTDIRVEVEDAVAVLAGSVRTHDDRAQAAELAFGAVRNVVIINRLAIVPTADARDREIAASVWASIAGVRDLDLDMVSIEVQDRIVTVSGKVADWNVLFSTENAVRKAAGVEEVRNDLIIGIF